MHTTGTKRGARTGKSRFGDPGEGRTVRKVIQGVPGRGFARAQGVCRRLGMLETTPWKRVTADQRASVETAVASLPARGEALRQRRRETRRALVESQSVRGMRRRRGLPVRGQRTRTNATTAKRLNPKRVQALV